MPAITLGLLGALAFSTCRGDEAGVVIDLVEESGRTLIEVRAAELSGDAPIDAASLARALRVYVDLDGANDSEIPPVAGTCQRTADGLRFHPRYPLRPGLTYRVNYDGGPLGADASRVERRLSLPEGAPPVAPRVVAIYPSAAALPENLLRIYLHFDQPMRQGEAYRHIALLEADATPVDAAFLELGEELWDRSGTRLTLLLDPGRVKRGLRPRAEEGPAIVDGFDFVLVIRDDWRSALGAALAQEHRKRFSVTPPDYDQPDVDAWTLHPPASDTRATLRVELGDMLDRAMMQRAITVIGADGGVMPGAVEVLDDERVWTFTPSEEWSPGKHRLRVDTSLEDPCGNSVRAPFEVDLIRPPSRAGERETVDREFEVR